MRICCTALCFLCSLTSVLKLKLFRLNFATSLYPLQKETSETPLLILLPGDRFAGEELRRTSSSANTGIIRVLLNNFWTWFSHIVNTQRPFIPICEWFPKHRFLATHLSS